MITVKDKSSIHTSHCDKSLVELKGEERVGQLSKVILQSRGHGRDIVELVDIIEVDGQAPFKARLNSLH